MLVKPNLRDEKLIACMNRHYGLDVYQIEFLPIGADLNTAVYRAESKGGALYFVKLRSGGFLEASVAVPNYLGQLGIKHIIPPVNTRNGRLWVDIDQYKLILYPFVEGLHGYERKLTDQEWIEFGAAVRQFHKVEFPAQVTRGVPIENYSTRWRDSVILFLERVDQETYRESVASQTAALLRSKSEIITDLINRADRLARNMQAQSPTNICCHGDMHAWNLLVTAGGDFYLVDWDTLIFAPKERDLMFVGAGLGGGGHTPQKEEVLFYQGYGQTQINSSAIAYYRYERIVEDISIFCEQIFLSVTGGKDREQALTYLKSNFLPGGMIDLACRVDRSSISSPDRSI